MLLCAFFSLVFNVAKGYGAAYVGSSFEKNLRRKSIITATNYALSYLGMCEAFIIMDSISKEIENYLIQNGYEGLGKDEKGKNIFLIEKNPKEINKGNYHETRR